MSSFGYLFIKEAKQFFGNPFMPVVLVLLPVLLMLLVPLAANMEVRDVTFAQEFNDFCQTLRQDTDKQEEAWAQVRAQVRSWTKDDYGADMALPAKGFNNKAKTLSRMCDEFSTEYHRFYRLYQGYTAQKLNVWLLTSCASTINNITDKVLFLAREIAQKAERYRR